MLKSTKSKTINAIAYIIENDMEIQVASMYASIDNKGNRSETVSILDQSQKIYEQNKDEVEADIAEFRRMANNLANGGTQNEFADNGI